MTWFKVDDGLAFHAKVVLAGNAAMGLWVRAGSWVAQQLTDGYIPDQIVTTLGTRAQAKALENAGLWIREGNGYRFHGWLDYNPTAEEVRADQARKHEAKVNAGRAGGLASGVARRKHKGSSDEANAKQNGSKTKPRPDPSRPNYTTEIQGGSHVSSGTGTTPPLYPDHCADHQVPRPPDCGRCADARKAHKAAARPLALVTDTFNRPDWCGHCNEFTRLFDSEDDNTPSRRCTVCHPLAKESA